MECIVRPLILIIIMCLVYYYCTGVVLHFLHAAGNVPAWGSEPTTTIQLNTVLFIGPERLLSPDNPHSSQDKDTTTDLC